VLVLVKILPPATRVVFNMSVVEGYSHKEIAQTLNMSESTSRWHLTEAKKRLQQLIREKEKIVSA
jgi:RNA polymerase sigma-70 factor (ECF subfamily)